MINQHNITLKLGGPLIATTEIIFDSTLQTKMRKKISKSQLKTVTMYARKIKITRIRYRSNNHDVIGFVAEPRRVRGKIPCIIWNRGGSREFGAWNIFMIFTQLGRMASWGYIVITTQYSGNGGSEGKDEFGGADLNDVLVLRRVLARHTHADCTRMGMGGGSRGGLMTYLALAKVKWAKAAVSIAGPTNLIRQTKLRPEMKTLFREMFGGRTMELKKRSAIFWANRFHKKTPLLMIHGTADWRVSPLDSIDLSATLLAHGTHHRLVLFDGDDHGISKFHNEEQAMIRQWFDRFLKSEDAR